MDFVLYIVLCSAVTIGEAVRMARDFNMLCENEFPYAQVASHLLREDDARRHTRQKIEHTKCALSESLLNSLNRAITTILLLQPQEDSSRLPLPPPLDTCCRETLQALVELLNAERSPLCVMQNVEPILDESVQRPLTHFSLITHGFGTPAIIAALNAALGIFGEMLSRLGGGGAAAGAACGVAAANGASGLGAGGVHTGDEMDGGAAALATTPLAPSGMPDARFEFSFEVRGGTRSNADRLPLSDAV